MMQRVNEETDTMSVFEMDGQSRTIAHHVDYIFLFLWNCKSTTEKSWKQLAQEDNMFSQKAQNKWG